MSENHVVCHACGATSPADAEQYPMGPWRWLFEVHYPAKHPDRVRTGLEKLRADLMDEAS